MTSTPPSSTQVWEAIYQAALEMPGVRVDREQFLRSVLAKNYSAEVVEKAVTTRPVQAGIPAAEIKKLAQGCIAWHRAGVSTADMVGAIPGGWAVLATVPLSMAQYFYHIIVILQKLAYLYGWPDFFGPEKERLDEESRQVVTVFIGVMFETEGASRMLQQIGESIGQLVIRKFPPETLARLALYPFTREVARMMGAQLSREMFARVVSRIMPVLSGLIAGAVTWFAFNAMAEKLRAHLETMHLAQAE